MRGLTLAFLGFGLSAGQGILPADVYENRSRDFMMPIKLTAEERGKLKSVRFLVSQDRGKTWVPDKTVSVTEEF